MFSKFAPCVLTCLFLAVPAFGQPQSADAEIYWCPMRGNPCAIEDYHAAGRCKDCGMALVTKEQYEERMGLAAKSARSVGIVLYPGFELLDVAGPVEMWAYVPEMKLHIVAEKIGPVKSTQGVEMVAEYDFSDCPKLDILMIPGGAGTLREVNNAAMLNFLRDRHAQAEITTSVCSGSAILAKAGILDGKKATSNKQFFGLAKQQSGKVDWVWEARWVDDGNVVTSSGVSAGMDMALHVIKRLHGEAAAKSIADGTEYQWHQDPSDDPFARMLKPE